MIIYGASALTISRNLILTGNETGAADVLGAFLDGSGTQLYVIANVGSTRYFRRIDLTNIYVPVGSNWILSDTTYPIATGSDALGDQNTLCFDIATGTVYCVFTATDTNAARHGYIAKINLSNGEVTYSAEQLLTTSSAFDFTPPVRGVCLDGSSLIVLHGASDGFHLSKYALGSFTFSTTVPTVPTTNENGVQATHDVIPLAHDQASRIPVGMITASDDNIIVLYDDANKAEKYYPSTLAYVGATAWSCEDVGSILASNGMIWTINDVASSESFKLNRFIDDSTGVVSKERSLYHVPQRTVHIGENEVVEIQFEARDDFGATMPQLSGQSCQVSLVTNRGAIDADDAALSLSSDPATFRNGTNIPINRSLVVPFDSEGVATFYFQSARTSSEFATFDMIRIDYL